MIKIVLFQSAEVQEKPQNKYDAVGIICHSLVVEQPIHPVFGVPHL